MVEILSLFIFLPTQLLLDITIIMKQMFLYKVQILRPKSKQKDNGHSLCVCDGLRCRARNSSCLWLPWRLRNYDVNVCNHGKHFRTQSKLLWVVIGNQVIILTPSFCGTCFEGSINHVLFPRWTMYRKVVDIFVRETIGQFVTMKEVTLYVAWSYNQR